MREVKDIIDPRINISMAIVYSSFRETESDVWLFCFNSGSPLAQIFRLLTNLSIEIELPSFARNPAF